MSVGVVVLTKIVQAYRAIPRFRQPVCRFDPSCSAYALAALEAHGAVRGLTLSMRRLARCHPWGGMGFDPVPEVSRYPVK